MEPVIFNQGTEDGGWKSVYVSDSADGVHRNDGERGGLTRDGLKLRPVILKKPAKKPNPTPEGIGRKEGGHPWSQETSWNSPGQVYDPSTGTKSDSPKDYYFAPNGSLAPVVFTGSYPLVFKIEEYAKWSTENLAGLLQSIDKNGIFKETVQEIKEKYAGDPVGLQTALAEEHEILLNIIREWLAEEEETQKRGLKSGLMDSNTGGSSLPLPSVQPPKETLYVDQDANVELGKDGFSEHQMDTGLDPAKRPRVPRGDRDMLLWDDEAQAYTNVGVEDTVFPLQGGLMPVCFAAGIFDKNDWKWGKPEEYKREMNDTIRWYTVPVTFKDDSKPMYYVFFILRKAPGKTGKVSMDDQIEPFVGLNKNSGSAQSKNKTVPAGLVANIPKEVIDAAASEFGKQEPAQKKGWASLLDDPALADLQPPMTSTEKLFTGLQSWDEDTFRHKKKGIPGDLLQAVQTNPQGQGHYFAWETDEKGLVVVKLEGWKKIEAEVARKRTENSD